MTYLEHVNITVTNTNETADWMMDVFDWHIRWQGPAISEGHTIDIGTGAHYLTLYAPPVTKASKHKDDSYCGELNHFAVVLMIYHPPKTACVNTSKPNCMPIMGPENGFISIMRSELNARWSGTVNRN